MRIAEELVIDSSPVCRSIAWVYDIDRCIHLRLLQNPFFRGSNQNRRANGSESNRETCSILQEPHIEISAYLRLHWLGGLRTVLGGLAEFERRPVRQGERARGSL